ncbi:MAG: cytochrome c [Cyclobacteriaceae bacterium]|nr:cytochrome c [Cyclobacteriaceae bacterium]
MKNSVIFIFIAFGAFSCFSSAEDIKLRRYMVAGERLYEQHCSNCHQLDGAGFQKLYPPIDGEYLKGNLSQVICGIKYGSSDSLTIKGVKYVLPMPDAHLTDLEVAEIVTYLSHTWADGQGIIGVNEVKEIVKECGDIGRQ